MKRIAPGLGGHVVEREPAGDTARGSATGQLGRSRCQGIVPTAVGRLHDQVVVEHAHALAPDQLGGDGGGTLVVELLAERGVALPDVRPLRDDREVVVERRVDLGGPLGGLRLEGAPQSRDLVGRHEVDRRRGALARRRGRAARR
jgi:hypothetical protein